MRGCQEGRGLLMVAQPNRRAAPRFDDVEIFFSGHPKDLLYTFVLECRYEQISSIHRIRSNRLMYR
jgi:hypothetical protein